MAGLPSTASGHAPDQTPSRGPLARLVENPNQADGTPPFALTDQSGAIQRYVEPVPGIDLTPHVGQVVVVRHDTGRILLASQLELPPPPLYPMLGDGATNIARVQRPEPIVAAAALRQTVQHAQYADDDDATVELLDDGEELPNGNAEADPEPMSSGAAYPDAGLPAFSAGPLIPGYPGTESAYYEPMQYGPTTMAPLGPAMAPCPECGDYHSTTGYDAGMPFASAMQPYAQPTAHLFADVEINFLRAHLMEDAVGKLSEKYEFSPRFTVGFTGVGPLDGRVRYWLYDRETPVLNDDGSIRFEFDVYDVEATHLFAGRRSDITLAAGIRFARIELMNEGANSGADLVGLTLAADGRTRLISVEAGRLAWVYGGRLSVLGGDWGGEGGGLIDRRVHDDNVLVHELYAGVEVARCYRRLDLRARLAFEMQNWHSDALAQNAGTDSIGIVGPGIRLGAEF